MSRAASLCRDDFQPDITWGEPARLMADAMKRGRPEQAWFWREEGTIRLDILWWEEVVFKTETSRMRRMIVIAFPRSWLYYLLHLCS